MESSESNEPNESYVEELSKFTHADMVWNLSKKNNVCDTQRKQSILELYMIDITSKYNKIHKYK